MIKDYVCMAINEMPNVLSEVILWVLVGAFVLSAISVIIYSIIELVEEEQ